MGHRNRSNARWLLASASAHAAVCAALFAALTRVAPSVGPPPVAAVEVSFEAPPPPVERPAVPVIPSAIREPVVPSVFRPARIVRGLAQASRPMPAPPAAASVPVAPVAPAPPRVLHAADLLRAGERTAAAMIGLTAPNEAPTAVDRAIFPGSTGSEDARVRAASQGFLRETLAATTVREAPGVRGYLWNVRRRVAESWRPGVVRVPNLADTLLAGFIAPERAVRLWGDRMIRRQEQALVAPPERVGGAADAIEAMGGVAGNGPNSRQNVPANAGDESWRRNVRTTRAEVVVEQNAAGRVLDVRLLHSSGITGFDRAALEAVRHGLEDEDPVTLPGGRVSRWSFTVVATRRLLTPSVGGQFDESRGWFRIEVPGQVSLRSRVQMESSAPREPVAGR